MAWAKRKAMSWEWFEHYAAESEIAPLLAQLASVKHKIMFVMPWTTDPQGNKSVLIISCKGTPIPVEPKVKKAKEAVNVEREAE